MPKSLLFILLIISCISCTHQRASYAWDDGGSDLFQDASARSRLSDNEAERPDQNKAMVIYEADIHLDVKTPDSTTRSIQEIAKIFDGYVLESGSDETIIRVPAASFESAIDQISKLGKVIYASRKGQDVSQFYHDSEIRLDNALKARERYLELLSKAENVTAALLVEKELERLNNEIESTKAQMNNLEHRSKYSTISVRVREKVKPGILGYIGIGLYKSVKWLFVRN